MTSDLDIYRGASILIREHGQDAALDATTRAIAMLDKGDLDRYAVWKRILRAVEEIQRTDPADDEPIYSAPPRAGSFFYLGRVEALCA